MSEGNQSGTPGRYTRSTGGLIGSMIVLVLVVLGIVVFRGAFRETPEYKPDHIDYLALVTSIQQAGLDPGLPGRRSPTAGTSRTRPSRPATGRSSTWRSPPPTSKYAGLHQEDRSVDDLIDTLLGTDATQGDDVDISGTVAPTWQTFSEPDGDHAFAAEVGDEHGRGLRLRTRGRAARPRRVADDGRAHAVARARPAVAVARSADDADRVLRRALGRLDLDHDVVPEGEVLAEAGGRDRRRVCRGQARRIEVVLVATTSPSDERLHGEVARPSRWCTACQGESRWSCCWPSGPRRGQAGSG